jgi:hypothetical protein
MLWYLLADYFKVPMDKSEAPTAEAKPMDLAGCATDEKPTWSKIVAKRGGETGVNADELAPLGCTI